MNHRVIHVVKMIQAHSGDKLLGQIVLVDHDAQALFDAVLMRLHGGSQNGVSRWKSMALKPPTGHRPETGSGADKSFG